MMFGGGSASAGIVVSLGDFMLRVFYFLVLLNPALGRFILPLCVAGDGVR